MLYQRRLSEMQVEKQGMSWQKGVVPRAGRVE